MISIRNICTGSSAATYGHTLVEQIFAGRNFRDFLKLAKINPREMFCTRKFAKINPRETFCRDTNLQK